MEVDAAAFEARAAGADAILPYAFLDGVGAPAGALCEAEVVVRGDVERARVRPGEGVGVVSSGKDSVKESYGATWYTGDGSSKEVLDALFEAAGIKGVEVRI